MIEFGPATCHDFQEATKLEWLETNGIGGFASSTIALANTRRYHGLLVAAREAPVGRVVLLAKLEESLLVRGDRFDLSSNQYPEIVYPQGHQYLESFRLSPYPVFTYRVPGAVLEKSLFLVHGENTLVVIYRLAGEQGAQLEVRPLIAFRALHDLGQENESLNRLPEHSPGVLSLSPYAGMPHLTFAHGGAFRSEGYWYKNFEYTEEAYRGYAFREDLYSYGTWTRTLAPGREAPLVVSTADASSMDAFLLREKETERRARIRKDSGLTGPRSMLALSADQLIVRRKDHLVSVMNGYPWFSEAGRDAAIALPGLTIATGRFGEARDLIRHLLLNVRGGLLPAAFPRDGEASAPEQPAVDASLWLFVAVHEYLSATGDDRFVRDEVAGTMLQIVRSYLDGIDHRIRVDSDDLVVTDDPGVPLTWMNARVKTWIATERAGKPVEVAALWINALHIAAELARLVDRSDDADRYEVRARRARSAFERSFAGAPSGCLYDTIGADGPDPSVRPNQIIALGLPFPVLGDEEADRVLAIAGAKLWTPCGLRTLSPDDERYRGRYIGDAWLREKACHQGSVWPWLIGPYTRALLRRGGKAAEAEVEKSIAFVDDHLIAAGVGTISELFDGDAPHTPRGAIAGCLAVAETLRVARDLESR